MTEEKSDIKKLAADPMFKLEHDTADKTKVEKLMPTLRELEEVQAQWQDDFGANSLMRFHLRNEKNLIKEQADSDKKFLDKWNINVDLVREHDDDKKLAALYKFNSLDDEKKNEEFSEEARATKRRSIELESIFNTKRSKTRTISMPQCRPNTQLNSKQLQIKGLKTKLNKSLQEKKLASSDLSSESNLFGIDRKNNHNNQVSMESIDCSSNLDSSLTKGKLLGLVKPSSNKNDCSGRVDKEKVPKSNCDHGNSLVSCDYGPSSDESDG